MKKQKIIGLLLLLIATPIFATSLDEVVNETLTNSATVESAKNTLLSNQLTAQLLLVEDNPSFSISTGTLSWGDNGSESDYESDYSLSPNLTIYLNDDNDTSISAKSEFSIDDGEITGQKLSAAIESTIDLNDEDISDDLTAEMNLYEATYLYNNSLLTVKSQVYTYIKNVLTYEKNLVEANNTLSVYQDDYSNAIEIGTYSEEDVAAKLQLSKIESQKNLIEQYEKTVALTKQQFESYTGLEYSTFDDFEDIELSIDATKLNSPIKIADYQTQIYEEELRLLKQDTNEVALTGGVAYDEDDDTTDPTTTSINTEATYSVNNLSFTGGTKGTWNMSTGSFTPYVTAIVTYTSDSTTAEDELEIQSMANKVQSSKLDYQEELSDHTLNVFSLQNDIQLSNLELQQFNFDKSVNLMNLENQQLLFDNGLLTSTDLDEAKMEVQVDLLEEQILKLERLILQTDIDKEFL
jgi:hypothetical protein